MKYYYDLYQLGRLIKRLYVEGAGLYLTNKEDKNLSEKSLLEDSEIVNNKAYELCQKLQLTHLEIYWKQIFSIIQNSNHYDQKQFLSELNTKYKLIDISIWDSLSPEELKVYKLGSFLSESWIYMVASGSFDTSDELRSIKITEEIHQNYESLNIILEEILISIHNADIDSFNKEIDNLINQIKKIDKDRQMNKKTDKNMKVNISGEGHNIQIGNDNQIIIEKAINELKDTIENSKATEEEKEEAKGLLNKILEHPIFSAIVGGAVSLL